MSRSSDVAAQRAYYRDGADAYDGLHVSDTDEHAFALNWLEGLIRFFGIRRILDVGCGTGRVGLALARRLPELEVFGLEPVPELIEKAIRNGYRPERLINGDALAPPFLDDAFDLVCEFGALHHIGDNERAVREMVRVAARGVFISDSNNFGQGARITRFAKQSLHKVGLWPLADFIKTRGKGCTVTEGDGVAYSYSVFNSVKLIRSKFPRSHFMNSASSGHELYREAPSVAMFFTKN